VHIDNLFEDGLLTPVEWDWSQALNEKWIRVGLLGNKVENTDLRFEELGKSLLKDCPDEKAAPQEWLAFSYRYAQARMLWTQISAPSARSIKSNSGIVRLANQKFLLCSPLTTAASSIIAQHAAYGASHSAAFPPAQKQSVQTLRLYSRGRTRIDQWLILKDVLKAQGLDAPSRKTPVCLAA